MLTVERVEGDEGAGETDDFIQGYDVVLESGLVFRDDALYAAASEGDTADLTGASALEEGYDPENEELEVGGACWLGGGRGVRGGHAGVGGPAGV
jgi:hypothetical protein